MSRNPRVNKWAREIEQRRSASRDKRVKLERRVARGIDRIVRLAQRPNNIEGDELDRASGQLDRLARIASSVDADLRTLRLVDREVRQIHRDLVAADMDDELMTLDEAEAEADDMYGDQSSNDTYYGLDDRTAMDDELMTLDEAEAEADDMYGDQSVNDSYYGLDRKGFQNDGEFIDEGDWLDR